jgi:hypothetical protein
MGSPTGFGPVLDDDYIQSAVCLAKNGMVPIFRCLWGS